MRAHEILFEDYNQQLESDLNNLLVGVKGNGASQVETQAVANQLQSMGYSVDVNSLMAALQNNPLVMNASPEVIQLTGSEEMQGVNGPSEDSAGRVGDMAQKATKIS